MYWTCPTDKWNLIPCSRIHFSLSLCLLGIAGGSRGNRCGRLQIHFFSPFCVVRAYWKPHSFTFYFIKQLLGLAPAAEYTEFVVTQKFFSFFWPRKDDALGLQSILDLGTVHSHPWVISVSEPVERWSQCVFSGLKKLLRLLICSEQSTGVWENPLGSSGTRTTVGLVWTFWQETNWEVKSSRVWFSTEYGATSKKELEAIQTLNGALEA